MTGKSEWASSSSRESRAGWLDLVRVQVWMDKQNPPAKVVQSWQAIRRELAAVPPNDVTPTKKDG